MDSEIVSHLSRLKHGILPFESQFVTLCQTASTLLEEEPNVLHLTSPIMVVGDLHGQFYDLLKIFENFGPVTEECYCFAGDYVDRGHHSLETILYLLLWKMRFPDRIFLLRGNHEASSINQVYGLYDECHRKYPCGDSAMRVYRALNHVFDLLPLTAVIDRRFFVVHGGISPEVKRINEIERHDRKQEVSRYSVLADLMWSDPDEELDASFWSESPRGCGYLFNQRALEEFCELNAIDCVLRAHQLQAQGYRFIFDEQLCTVWSAPNYCYKCGNLASVLDIDGAGPPRPLLFQESTRSKSLASSGSNTLGKTYSKYFM